MTTRPPDERVRSAATLRGLGFLERFALADACWSECAPDVQYMFFHLATRSSDRALSRRARRSAMRAALRWCRENPRLPPDATPSDVLWWYAYGATTPTELGLDTRAMRRDLARAARRHGPRDMIGFDPRRQAPPGTVCEPCDCGETEAAHGARCARCGAKVERLHRYQAWQAALVGAHIAEILGIDAGCTVADALRWRRRMQPYPDMRRRVTGAGWCAFYAVTHLVYVLDDYSLRRLDPGPLAAEIDLIHRACRHAIAGRDIEMLGESIDVLLALGETESGELITRARRRLLAAQNRDGSWGDRDDEPYTRFHKTWVALDGLTSYGRRQLARRRLPGSTS
jgi:hypothetical protein